MAKDLKFKNVKVTMPKIKIRGKNDRHKKGQKESVSETK